MNDADSRPLKTINIVIAALGGEGGGVLTGWIAEVAERENWLAQATSVPGVAQRTGTTIYYVELFPRSADREQTPVMALFPSQGDIDIAIASEIAEAGRLVQRGFVSPERTTLIASEHRVYGVTERAALADGIVDAASLQRVATASARQFIHYDMATLAQEHGTVISAALFGALAGSGALPFARESFEAVIGNTGKSVAANLAAFIASHDEARKRLEQGTPAPDAEDGVQSYQPPPFQLPPATTEAGGQLLERVAREFPQSAHELIYHGLAKLVDYQDFDYATGYLDRLATLLPLDDATRGHRLVAEVARQLALWMCFEDMPRVAQLKVRATRMEKIRREVRAEEGQLLEITEFFRPRVEEICGYLPPRLAEWAMASKFCNRFLGLFTGGKRLRTDTLGVYLLLRAMAGLRRRRRKTWIYQREHRLIGRWFDAVQSAAGRDYALAMELAECAGMVKGYGDTRYRGYGQLSRLLDKTEQDSKRPPELIARWREAALADDQSLAFDSAMSAQD